jgi:hypothetical protein
MTKAHVAHVYYIDKNGRPRVGWDNWGDMQLGDKLYAAPQREWVELTNDERLKLITSFHATEYALATAVEAALKEKNL